MKDELLQLEKKSFDWKQWFAETGLLFFVMSISRFLHSLGQIRDHGVPTWLPDWLLNADDWFSFSSVLDSYHVWKGLSFEVYGVSAIIAYIIWSYHPHEKFRVATQIVVAWLLSWQVFNLFYEYLWRL